MATTQRPLPPPVPMPPATDVPSPRQAPPAPPIHAHEVPRHDPMAGTRSALLLRGGRADRNLTRWLLGLLAAGVLALFLPWQQTVRGTGQVTALSPVDRPQAVQALITARIAEWLVAEGDTVVAGQPLLRLAEVQPAYLDPQLVERTADQVEGKSDAIDAKQAKVEAYTDQLAALARGREFELAQKRAALRQAELQIDMDSATLNAAIVERDNLQRQLARQQVMLDSGYYARTTFENAQNKAREAEAKVVSAEAKLARSQQGLLQSRIELDAVQAKYAESIAKAQAERSATMAEIGTDRAEVAKLRTSLTSLAERREFGVVRAPQDGIVVRAQRSGVGEIVNEGTALVTIQPSRPQLAAALYVDAMDVPLIHPGDPVRLQFDGWPALQVVGWPSVAVGTFGGRVAVVDQTSSGSNKYRVLVVPDAGEDAWPPQLRLESGVQGWALLREVTLGFEIWRQINGFPPSISEAPVQASSDAPKGAGGGGEKK